MSVRHLDNLSNTPDLHVYVLDLLILDLGENLEVEVVCAFQLVQGADIGHSPGRSEFALYCTIVLCLMHCVQ